MKPNHGENHCQSVHCACCPLHRHYRVRRAKVKPVAWNVSITKATPASIEADVVGVSASDKPYWMTA